MALQLAALIELFVEAVADGNHPIKIAVLDLTPNLAGALVANLCNFCTCCLCLKFPFGVDILTSASARLRRAVRCTPSLPHSALRRGAVERDPLAENA